MISTTPPLRQNLGSDRRRSTGSPFRVMPVRADQDQPQDEQAVRRPRGAAPPSATEATGRCPRAPGGTRP